MKAFLPFLLLLWQWSAAYGQTSALAKTHLSAKTEIICSDQSFGKQLLSQNNKTFVYSSLHTSDDGLLISLGLRDTTSAGNLGITDACISKMDNGAYAKWSKRIHSSVPGESMKFTTLFQRKDGSFIAGGYCYSSEKRQPILLCLDAQGNMLWSKSLFVTAAGNAYAVMDIHALTETQNTTLVLAGTITGDKNKLTEFCMRLNIANDVDWFSSFPVTGNDTWNIGVAMSGQYISLVGARSGGTEAQLHCLYLDTSNGHILSTVNNLPINGVPQNGYNSFDSQKAWLRVTSDSRLIVFGRLAAAQASPSKSRPYFAVAEFDTAFHFASGYTISSGVDASYDNMSIDISEKGKAVVTLVDLSQGGPDFYLAAIRNGQFLKQRKINSELALSGTNSLNIFNDGSYVNLQSFYGTVNGVPKSYIHVKKVYDSYSSGAGCFGQDSAFASSAPLVYAAAPGLESFWASDSSTSVITGGNAALSITPTVLVNVPGCFRSSSCDVIKLHAPLTICSADPQLTISATRSLQCGSAVYWEMDTTGGKNISFINDTLATIHFPGNWQGYVYGSLQGSCGNLLKDSILVKITKLEKSLDLGADTILCPGNSIALHVPGGYTDYAWDNGSHDAAISVSRTGIYRLSARNVCGDTETDSIQVLAAPDYDFSGGADTAVCAGSLLSLQATEGFSHYSWTETSSMKSSGDNSFSLQPQKNMDVLVQADKFPGCTISDTVHISVYELPVVQLGSDTSFCSGNSATITAESTAEISGYSWSTGDTGRTVIAKNAGVYTVEVTDIHHCVASASRLVQQLYPKPLVDLGKDRMICYGTELVLDAGEQKRYAWNTGDTTAAISIHVPATYSVTVSNEYGCTSSDSIRIAGYNYNPAGFLPDTMHICDGENLRLQATEAFSQYNWSNRESSSYITVSTTGTYWLQATSREGCRGLDSVVVVKGNCAKQLTFPTGFTPNHDGLNDVFRPITALGVTRYNLAIYNRLGQKIFESSDPARGWDGNVNNQPQQAGTYIWVCRYTLTGSSQPATQQGAIGLLR